MSGRKASFLRALKKVKPSTTTSRREPEYMADSRKEICRTRLSTQTIAEATTNPAVKLTRRRRRGLTSAVDPCCQFVHIAHIHADKRVVRTSAHTGRAAELIDAEIAFGSLHDRSAGHFIEDERAGAISRLHHLDVVIRATVRAGRAANAGVIVDHNLTLERFAMDRTSGTTDHTNRINAVHAGVRDHNAIHLPPMADESWVVIVSRRASAHTIVTAGAAIQVDQHRRRAVNCSVVHEKLQHVGAKLHADFFLQVDRRFVTRLDFPPLEFLWVQSRQNVLLNNGRPNHE